MFGGFILSWGYSLVTAPWHRFTRLVSHPDSGWQDRAMPACVLVLWNHSKWSVPKSAEIVMKFPVEWARYCWFMDVNVLFIATGAKTEWINFSTVCLRHQHWTTTSFQYSPWYRDASWYYLDSNQTIILSVGIYIDLSRVWCGTFFAMLGYRRMLARSRRFVCFRVAIS